MNVFVAGASGAIGRPLDRRAGPPGARGHRHDPVGRGCEALADLGAAVARVSAFDADGAASGPCGSSGAEVVIDELTALPEDPSEMAAAAAGDRKLRLEGGGNLHRRRAGDAGSRRYIQQASGFFLRPGPRARRTSPRGWRSTPAPAWPRAPGPTPSWRRGCWTPGAIEGVALRYGFFYGPGTWYHPDGASADQVRRGEIPIIGEGEGVWSWVHIDDAAIATADALDGPARRVQHRR